MTPGQALALALIRLLAARFQAHLSLSSQGILHLFLASMMQFDNESVQLRTVWGKDRDRIPSPG